jgi:hypothetical protein
MVPSKPQLVAKIFNSKFLFMVNAGLFVEENVSRDENSKAAVDEAPSSKKFLRFKIEFL